MKLLSYGQFVTQISLEACILRKNRPEIDPHDVILTGSFDQVRVVAPYMWLRILLISSSGRLRST